MLTVIYPLLRTRITPGKFTILFVNGYFDNTIPEFRYVKVS